MLLFILMSYKYEELTFLNDIENGQEFITSTFTAMWTFEPNNVVHFSTPEEGYEWNIKKDVPARVRTIMGKYIRYLNIWIHIKNHGY